MNKYTNRYILITFVFFTFLMLASYNVTHSFFNTAAMSSNNVFAAAKTFPTIPFLASPTPTPNLTGIANHVVISEIQITGGSNNTDNDFVELYNPTNFAVNISGWKLRKRIASGIESSLDVIDGGKLISAHGYFLWANTNFSINSDESTGSNITADNSVALLTSANTMVDQVAWGTGHVSPFGEGGSFTSNPEASQSLERKAYSTSTTSSMLGLDAEKGNGYDTNNNSNDFVLRSVSQPQNSSNPIEVP